MSVKPVILYPREIQQLLKTGHVLMVRPMKPQPNAMRYTPIAINGYAGWTDEHGRPMPCPLGQPWDRLWVRESFWIEHDSDGFEMCEPFDCGVDIADGEGYAQVWYCATQSESDIERHFPPVPFYSKHGPVAMPRWASRLTVEVERVEPHRVGDDFILSPDGAHQWETKWGKQFPLDGHPWAWLVWVRKIGEQP